MGAEMKDRRVAAPASLDVPNQQGSGEWDSREGMADKGGGRIKF